MGLAWVAAAALALGCGGSRGSRDVGADHFAHAEDGDSFARSSFLRSAPQLPVGAHGARPAPRLRPPTAFAAHPDPLVKRLGAQLQAAAEALGAARPGHEEAAAQAADAHLDALELAVAALPKRLAAAAAGPPPRQPLGAWSLAQRRGGSQALEAPALDATAASSFEQQHHGSAAAGSFATTAGAGALAGAGAGALAGAAGGGAAVGGGQASESLGEAILNFAAKLISSASGDGVDVAPGGDSNATGAGAGVGVGSRKGSSLATSVAVAATDRRGVQAHAHGADAADSASWLEPAPQDLALVEAWAKELAEAAGAPVEAAQQLVREDPGSALLELKKLAGEARMNNDGIDRDMQALCHLLELHFQRRRVGSQLTLTRDVIRQVADDYRRLSQLRDMRASDLARVAPAEDGDVDLLLQYYRGLTARGRGLSRPRALVLSCSFGDGHKSAAEAVTSYLEQARLSVQTVDTSRDKRFRVGIAASLGINPTYVYNNLVLRKQWYRLHNLWDSLNFLVFGQVVKPCPAPDCNTAQKDQFRGMLLEVRPDLLVTVYHMDLLPILEVAKDLGNIPVLHIATDMDIKMREVFGSFGPAPVYPKLLVGVPFNNNLSLPTISPLAPARTFLSGYPIRSPFLRSLPDPASLLERRRRESPNGTKVVLVMSGGGGQDLPWPERLAEQGIGVPLHIIVVAGRDQAIPKRLAQALPLTETWPDGRTVRRGISPDVTVEVAVDPKNTGSEDPYYIYADRLAELMDLSDAVITKPGGGTAAELAYRGTPALFDASAGLLHWEEFTVQVFEQAGRGSRFADDDDLRQALWVAFQRGRDTKLAADPEHPGSVLDTGTRIRAAARRLMTTQCTQCPLFPTAAA